MKENILEDDFDRFISAFERFKEIFLLIQWSGRSLEMMKVELVEKLLDLARELNLNLKSEQIPLIYEKLKLRYNFKEQHKVISFNGSDDEMTSDAEGPWWFYLNKENQNNEEPT